MRAAPRGSCDNCRTTHDDIWCPGPPRRRRGDHRKAAGQASLDTYEKALQSLVDFEQKAATASQLEWVSAVASAHAKFVQDVSAAYVTAAREALK